MKSGGLTSVATAVIMALAIIAIIGLIVISTPLARSIVDRTNWASLMGSYEPPKPINSSIGFGEPALDGYCLVYSVSNGYYNVTYYSCPSIIANNTAAQQPP
ncbi:hypothetical protein [Vulcanisaeta distributa]|uniref:hypothetical protein n=1 Tax=Vulcanisaeta distributa TaxID=164451 RepID=UPI0006D0A755|nr:hypothetical protein [Vulcanisaeta distributa]